MTFSMCHLDLIVRLKRLAMILYSRVPVPTTEVLKFSPPFLLGFSLGRIYAMMLKLEKFLYGWTRRFVVMLVGSVMFRV